MQIEQYETMVATAEERLSIDLFGMNYEQLGPELQEWVRARVIASLWDEYTANRPMAAA